MKSLIAVLALTVSANVFAYSVAVTSIASRNITYATSMSTALTSGAEIRKEANAVINDAQDMLQTGEASSFLSQKIQETQDLNEGASESEALDILVNSAQEILAN